MLSKEELDSWNEVVTDCKIRETDLTHPSEEILTKTLIAYLRLFGYKVEPPFQTTTEEQSLSREKRLFLVKLARQIDYILKITKQSYSFTYYDLIAPTSKKTSHTLGILLNHIYYYNMYKTNVFKIASERINRREELQQRIHHAQKENEQRQRQAAKIKEDSAKLKQQVPAAKTELEGLSKCLTKNNETLCKLKETVAQLEIKTKELREQKRTVKFQIVPNSEAQELEIQYNKLEDEIADRQAVEEANKQSLKERSAEIAVLEHLAKRTDEAQNIVPIELLQKLKDNSKQLKALEEQLNTLISKRTQLIAATEKQQHELKTLGDKTKYRKQQHQEDEQNDLNLFNVTETQYDADSVQLATYKQEAHLLECALQQQMEIEILIKNHVDELLAAYKTVEI